jgi:hypothetical protein
LALDSYLGLITAVQDFTGRSDLTTAKVDYFIDLAESYFNQNLRTHHMETTNGSLTYSSGAITNPADFLGWKHLSITSNGTKYQLQPVALEQNNLVDDGTTGLPSRYIVRGESTLLRPTPDSSGYTVEGTYYQKVPALSASQTSNWILTNYADAYLYGALAMSAAFTKDDPRISIWQQLFQMSMAGIRKTDVGKGFGQVGVMTMEYPLS